MRDLKSSRQLALKVGVSLVALDLTLALLPDSFRYSSRIDMSAARTIGHAVREHDHATTSNLTTRKPARAEAETTEKPVASSKLSADEIDLCRIKKSAGVPLDGELKLQSVPRLDGGRSYWLKSSNCPDELYSIVSIDENGRIDKEINCNSTSLTELVLNSGLQFTVDIAAADPRMRSMAISGEGHFLVNCPDSGLTLTRDGRFNQEQGPLISSEGCTAWTRKNGGRAVQLAPDEPIDTNGCSLATGECLEILGTDERDVDAFNFKTKNSISILNERGLKPLRRPYVFSDSFEDLDTNDRSLTGVANWETLKPVAVPTNCPE